MGEHKISKRILPTVVSDFLDSNVLVAVNEKDGSHHAERATITQEWANGQSEVIGVDDIATTIKEANDTNENPLVDLSGIRLRLPFDRTVLAFQYEFEDSGKVIEEGIFLNEIGVPPPNVVAHFPAFSAYVNCKTCLQAVVVDRVMLPGMASVIVGSFTMGIDESGYAVRLTEKATWDLGAYFLCVIIGSGGHQQAAMDLSFAARVAMATLCLLGCRNISVKTFETTPRVYYEEHHRHKLPRYHVIDIEPMRQKFRDANGGKDGISLAKALHICRGHFKNFDDKPLFGKLTGTYWWQPHVRGTAEAGIVEKDYRIKLGSEAPHR